MIRYVRLLFTLAMANFNDDAPSKTPGAADIINFG